MQFKKWTSKVVVAVLTLQLALPLTVNAQAGNEVITRGEFFELVAAQLELTPSSETVLPKDVAEDASYADAVLSLLERQAIVGYPDGSVKPAQPISAKEAAYVLGRLLGFDDTESLTRLKDELSLNWSDATKLTRDTARNALNTTLVSDESAVVLMEASQLEQMKATSFAADYSLDLDMETTDEEFPSLVIKSKGKLKYNESEGISQVIDMSFPAELGVPTVTTATYIMPDAVYVSSFDPASGAQQWFKQEQGLDLKELMLEQSSQMLQINEWNRKYFIIRDLGTETIDGNTYAKVGLYARIPSFGEMLDDTMNIPGLQALFSGNNEDLLAMSQISLSMNMIYLIDPATNLAYSSSMSGTMLLPADDLVPPMKIIMKSDYIYSGYNEPQSIILPEVARDAQVMPVLPF